MCPRVDDVVSYRYKSKRSDKPPMKGKNVLFAQVLYLLWASLAIGWLSMDIAYAGLNDAIGNGGFEKGALSLNSGEAPISNGDWVGSSAGSTAPPRIVTSPVADVKYAVQIDTTNCVNGTAIYQDIRDIGAASVIAFSVFRNSGINRMAIAGDWDRGRGKAVGISAMQFDDAGTSIAAWGNRKQLPFVLSEGVWHRIVIRAGDHYTKQTFCVDGRVIGQIALAKSKQYDTVTFIIGDTAWNAQHGNYLYDNISMLLGENGGEMNEEGDGACDGDDAASSEDVTPSRSIFKCQDSSGAISFADQPCPSGSRGSDGEYIDADEAP